MASKVSDLVLDSKLETTFLPNGEFRHAYHAPGTTTNERDARIEETWRRRRRLGVGSYGEVWLEETSGTKGSSEPKLRAVKEIRKDPSMPDMNYDRELEAIAKFSHKRYVHCFVQSLGWFENDTTVYIAMEYLSHGDLQTYVGKPFPEPEARQIGIQVIQGLKFMHENGFAHRDIKPKNILVYNPGPAWWVKLADFGISKRLKGSTALRTVHVGTHGFIAPEILGLFPPDEPEESEEPDPDAFEYTVGVDMWAVGEVLMRLLTNQPTFDAPRQLYKYVIQGSKFPSAGLVAAKVSDDCISFVEAAMAASQAKRPSAEQALQHPWLRQHQFIVNKSEGSIYPQTGTHKTIEDPHVQEPSLAWTTVRPPLNNDPRTMSSVISPPQITTPAPPPPPPPTSSVTPFPPDSSRRKINPGDLLLSKHDFTARSEDELTFPKNITIQVIEDDGIYNDGWYLGRRTDTGHAGLFPEVFTAPLPPLPSVANIQPAQTAAPQPAQTAEPHRIPTPQLHIRWPQPPPPQGAPPPYTAMDMPNGYRN